MKRKSLRFVLNFLVASGELSPPPPVKCECIHFCTNMRIWSDLEKIWHMIWVVVDLLTLKLLIFRLIITY